MANLTLRRTNQPNVPAQSGPSSYAGWDPFRLMESLLGWDPFQEMVPSMRQGGQGQAFLPHFEVKETKDAYISKADLPGVKESDVDISLTGNQLTISGKREAETHEDVKNFFVYERSYGTFTRSFTVPQSADPQNVKADMKDGVLTLTLPKRPEMQPRKITLGQNDDTTATTGKKANA
jgi:HSP20 family protein